MKSDPANKGIENFLDFLASIKRLSPKTIEAYRRDLLDWNGLGLPLDIHNPPTKTKTQDVLSKHLELKLEKSSQSRKRSALRSFAHFASLYNEGWKALFTWVPGAESSDDLPRALSQEEVELLLKSEMGIKLEDFRNKALLELLYASGLRISEALGLEWNDIDFQQNLIRVLGKGSKERVIPFSPRAAYWLEEYKLRLAPWQKKSTNSHKNAIFLSSWGRPLTRMAAWKILKKRGLEVGLEGLHPHILRHSLATHLLQGGADVRVLQALLGHFSLNTTSKYLKISDTELQTLFAEIHPLR